MVSQFTVASGYLALKASEYLASVPSLSRSVRWFRMVRVPDKVCAEVNETPAESTSAVDTAASKVLRNQWRDISYLPLNRLFDWNYSIYARLIVQRHLLLVRGFSPSYAA